MAFFEKKRNIFIICFLKVNLTCIFICFPICNLWLSLSYFFSVLKNFQGFRLNFINQNERFLGGGVDNRYVVKWLKVYFWKAKQHMALSQGNQRWIKFIYLFIYLFTYLFKFNYSKSVQVILSSSRDLSHSLDMVKTGLFFIFFRNVNC